MLNTKHLITVTAVWTSVVYVICFAGVALFPGVREGFMTYALHIDIGGIELWKNILTFGTFTSGFVIWNIIAVAAVWLFAFLYNTIRQQ